MREKLMTAVDSVRTRTNFVFTPGSGDHPLVHRGVLVLVDARLHPGGDVRVVHARAGEEAPVLLEDGDVLRLHPGGDHRLEEREDELLVRPHVVLGDAVHLHADHVVRAHELLRRGDEVRLAGELGHGAREHRLRVVGLRVDLVRLEAARLRDLHDAPGGGERDEARGRGRGQVARGTRSRSRPPRGRSRRRKAAAAAVPEEGAARGRRRFNQSPVREPWILLRRAIARGRAPGSCRPREVYSPNRREGNP